QTPSSLVKLGQIAPIRLNRFIPLPEDTRDPQGSGKNQQSERRMAPYPFGSAPQGPRLLGADRFVAQPPFKILGEFQRRGITLLGRFLQTFQADHAEVAWNMPVRQV